MRKELFTLILLALIPTFSMANVNEKPVKNEVKESKDIVATTSESTEYLTSEIIQKKDGTTYTLDGKKLTGNVVFIPMSKKLMTKVVSSFKDGKEVKRTFYDRDNKTSMYYIFKDGKITNIHAYYQDGKDRAELDGDGTHFNYGFAYYPNGKLYIRLQSVIDPKDDSRHRMLKIYNLQEELIAQISTNPKEPYANCILPNGSIKKMTHIHTDHKIELKDDDFMETHGDILNDVQTNLSSGNMISLLGMLEELTQVIENNQEFKCEYE